MYEGTRKEVRERLLAEIQGHVLDAARHVRNSLDGPCPALTSTLSIDIELTLAEAKLSLLERM